MAKQGGHVEVSKLLCDAVANKDQKKMTDGSVLSCRDNIISENFDRHTKIGHAFRSNEYLCAPQ